MPYSSTTSGGCSGCGGSYRPSSPQYATTGNHAALATTSTSAQAHGNAGSNCGCHGGCQGGCGCQTGATYAMAPSASARNYNADECPTFAISCETKQALRDCIKVALCDFLRCATDTFCPDGRFDLERLKREQDQLPTQLINCVGQLACSFMHCVPEVLCPEPCKPKTTVDVLPCDYAVEVLR